MWYVLTYVIGACGESWRTSWLHPRLTSHWTSCPSLFAPSHQKKKKKKEKIKMKNGKPCFPPPISDDICHDALHDAYVWETRYDRRKSEIFLKPMTHWNFTQRHQYCSLLFVKTKFLRTRFPKDDESTNVISCVCHRQHSPNCVVLNFVFIFRKSTVRIIGSGTRRVIW